MAAAGQQVFTCVATGCGRRYDPAKTRALLRGLCSQRCLDALAKELGWKRTPRNRPTQHAVVKDELRRRRDTVPGADPSGALPSLGVVIGPGLLELTDPVRARHLADAYVHVARANHYMVGVVAAHSDDELDAAEQALITSENGAPLGSPERVRIALALDLVEQAKRDRQRAGGAPFAGVEPYYARLFSEIRERHNPQGTGGDMSCLMAMVEWLWARHPKPVPGCPGCGTHDHAHSIAKHEASGIPLPPQGVESFWDGVEWVAR